MEEKKMFFIECNPGLTEEVVTKMLENPETAFHRDLRDIKGNLLDGLYEIERQLITKLDRYKKEGRPLFFRVFVKQPYEDFVREVVKKKPRPKNCPRIPKKRTPPSQPPASPQH